jgi:D-glycero-D-manno-heptose 1,7-bisphosphate phosphatase
VSAPTVVVFDADDTLRRTLVSGQPCPHAEDEWELIEGVSERLLSLPSHVRLGVASNQDHVGYGLVSADLVRRMLHRMIEAASGRAVDDAAVRFCPHRLEETCACRKPAPGMLVAIAAHYGVAARDVLFIGNSTVDRDAAARAGSAFEWAHVFFRTPASHAAAARSSWNRSR